MGERRDQKAMAARRRRAGRLFGHGHSQAEVARRLGVSRVSAKRWYDAWSRAGSEGPRSTGSLGRRPRLEESDWLEVEQVLLAGPQVSGFDADLWTLRRVAEVIESTAGVAFHPGHVWRVLRGRGWSLQRPTTRARERDEDRILEWRKKGWRRLKKTSVREERSSSSTKRASRRAR